MIALYTMLWEFSHNTRPAFFAALCLAGLFILCPGCSEKKADVEEPAAAMVNGEPILKKDLEKEILRIDKTLSVRPSQDESRRFSQRFLDQMIRKRLLLQEAKKSGIELIPEQIRKAVSEQKGDISKEDFEKMLKEAGITYQEWVDRITDDRRIEMLIHRVIDPGIQITEEELTAYYQNHPEEFDLPERVKARQIVLPGQKDAEKARERLVHGGEEFGLVAHEVSLSPDAARGGDIGIFSRGQMPPDFDKACFALQVGEISPVVKTPYGYHIFLVEERLAAGKIAFKEARKDIYNKLFSEKREQAFLAYQKDLWNRSEITLLNLKR
ncbi:MAG: peptidyl-prolyl cis-trans isomerase [bacterium]